MTTFSEAEGKNHMQTQRGGNLALPARVEVTVRVGGQRARITLHIEQDGEFSFGTETGDDLTETADDDA